MWKAKKKQIAQRSQWLDSCPHAAGEETEIADVVVETGVEIAVEVAAVIAVVGIVAGIVGEVVAVAIFVFGVVFAAAERVVAVAEQFVAVEVM